MKKLIKGFNEFINESDAPSHNLLRAIHAKNKAGTLQPPSSIMSQINDLDPEEKDRLYKLADRTKKIRSKDLNWDKDLLNFLKSVGDYGRYLKPSEQSERLKTALAEIGDSRDEQTIKKVVSKFYDARKETVDLMWNEVFGRYV